MEFFIILIILLIGLLYWLNRNGTITIDLNNLSNNSNDLDIQTFDKYYAGRRMQINAGRLASQKENEYVIVFLLAEDASKKNKKSVNYKDIPKSPKVTKAFYTFVNNPDEFFDKLVAISAPSDTGNTNVASMTNESNLGLQIVNRPVKTSQYIPRDPSPLWKHVQRSSSKFNK